MMSEHVQSIPSTHLFPKWTTLLRFLILGLAVGAGICLNEQGFLGSRLQYLSPFKIQQVKIISEWPLTISEVQSWLPILEGKSLLQVKPEEIIASLKQRPWIEHVTIKKQYPDRLWIEVETKRPRALSVIKGIAYFIDPNGNVIEKARPRILKALDVPFLTVSTDHAKWNISSILTMTEQFKTISHAKYSISQVILGNYPYFKIFLDNPKLEVLLNIENWESQSRILENLLLDPPSQIGQPQRINLIFPKKAVVSIHN